MRKKRASKTGTTVIVGYLLIVMVMLVGLFVIYRNLVSFSDNRLKNEDHIELLYVSNILSKLYEVESEQNLFTSESAALYFRNFDSIVPQITSSIDSLKQINDEPLRSTKLDSIVFLIGEKRDNLEKIALLLDSINTAPKVKMLSESSFVPPALNKEIAEYLTDRDLNPSLSAESDTSVVKGQRKGFMDRVRDVFIAPDDSIIIIEKRSVVTANQFQFMVDTLINKVRISEKLDLESRKKIELQLVRQLDMMGQTNHMLTSRIDALLKSVEQEEISKKAALVIARERAILGSQQTLFIASASAALIGLLFGFLFLMDLNKSRRYRRELEQSNHRISDLLAAREKLMLTISHDIKAPMSSIMGYVELMEDEKVPEKRTRFLSNMKKSGEHIFQLISNLLDYHRVELGRWKLKECGFNLFTLTEETVQSFRPLALQKELNYVVNNQIPEDNMYFSDPYVIRQIISNLLSNAIKYTSAGEVSVVLKEEIRNGSTWLFFSVTDTGEGISETDQKLIFQEFHRLDERERQVKPVEGSGLGLAITKGFVEVMNGEMNLTSEVGKGSSFMIGLPLKTYMKDTVENKTSVARIKPIERGSALVVDDDTIQLMMVSEMLQKLNMRCQTVNDPEKVIPLLKEQTFDIILMDIQMPNINGFMLVDKLKAAFPESRVPLIALSARTEIEVQDFRDAGFSGSLPKPFTLQKLSEILDTFLHVGNVVQEDNIISNSDHLLGVGALINFVKDDEVVSKTILQSFIDETRGNITDMQLYFEKDDIHAASELSHKMLPLFRMMQSKIAVMLLSRLEKEEQLSVNEEKELLELMKQSVTEAEALVKEFSSVDK